MGVAYLSLAVVQVAMGAVGLARRALYEASHYAMQRKTFGVPIIQVYTQSKEISNLLFKWAYNVLSHFEALQHSMRLQSILRIIRIGVLQPIREVLQPICCIQIANNYDAFLI